MNRILFLLFIFSLSFSAQKIIYIIPPRGYGQEKLFNLTDRRLNRDNSQLVFVRLKEELNRRGYIFSTLKKYAQKADVVVCFNIPDPHSRQWKELLHLVKKRKQIVTFIFEPVTVNPWIYDKKRDAIFDRIYTLEDDLIDNKKYFKFFYPQPELSMVDEELSFSEKKLVTLIAFNKQPRGSNPETSKELYSERHAAIKFFNQYPEDFSFYGGGWSQESYQTYGGLVDQKVDVLKQYKFCLCYENTANVPGYITEKIFDCMIAGCVPIYWGAPNIDRYIPPGCFINRENFKNNAELYQFIRDMDENQYQVYIENIKLFLENESISLFSIELFIRLFCKAIKEY